MRLKEMLVVAAAAAMVIPHISVRAADSKYEQVESWKPIPVPPGPEWEMRRVATNRQGTKVYAVRQAEPPILEIDPASGKILKMWGQGLFVWPHGLYVDRDGFLWVTDAAIGGPPQLNRPMAASLRGGRTHQVHKLAPDGRLVLTLGKGVAGNDAETFNAPTDVVVAANGDIFVSDGHGGDTNARIVKFSKEGKFIKAWGRKGSGPGEFDAPHALALDSRGRLFVADRTNARIQIFDQEGRFLEQWKQFGGPSGIAIAPDDTILVTIPKRIGVGSAKDGSIAGYIDGVEAEGITVDNNGNVYASEVFRRTLKKFVKTPTRTQ
jgi:DNA-binding beta-propeller fold protein YncE